MNNDKIEQWLFFFLGEISRTGILAGWHFLLSHSEVVPQCLPHSWRFGIAYSVSRLALEWTEEETWFSV